MRNIGAARSLTAGETDAARMAFFRSRRRSRKPLGAASSTRILAALSSMEIHDLRDKS